MNGIVVGYDGSGHSVRALEWAAYEAAVRNAPLTVLTVRQPAPGRWTGGVAGDSDPERAPARIDELAQKAFAQSGADLPRPRVTIQSVGGVPADELVRAAAGADMVVVGARGAGGFRKLLLGSVSCHLTHHARCPVVVVPGSREEER